MSEPAYVLYRFFNKDNELLYVGITNDPINRFTHHAYRKTWFKEVTTCTMENFPTREALAAAERHAIRTESPKHNKMHADKPPKKQVARREPSKRIAALLSDGNRFDRPDGIALEYPLPTVYRSYTPCPDCGCRIIDYRHVPGKGSKSRYVCPDCDGTWTWLEYGDAMGFDERPLLERLAKAAERYRGRFS